MDELTINEARGTDLKHWLNAQSRCFGDKGDVEDITEGRVALARSWWLGVLIANLGS